MTHDISRRSLLAGTFGTVVAATVAGDALAAVARPSGQQMLPMFTPLSQRVGVNQQSVKGPAMSDTNLRAAATSNAVDLFRYPGGTTANFWDWQKGWVIDDAELALHQTGQQFIGQNPTPWYLEDLAAFCTATGTTPVFVLNIATSDQQYQLDMLAHAASLGLPIDYVELGNEFYWGSNQDLFQDVAAYASRAATWADAIKLVYPNAEIAAVAWDGNSLLNAGTRSTTWNAGMNATLAASTSITAVTMHPYVFMNGLQTNYGQLTDLSTLDDQRRMMALGFNSHADTSATMDNDVPAGKNLWVTEYNLSDPNGFVMARWLHGLFVAIQAITLLDEPGGTMSLVHSLAGAPSFSLVQHPVYVPIFANKFGVTPPAWAPTAPGVTIGEVFNALEGADGYAMISFPEATTITIDVAGENRTYPSLLGVAFDHPGSSYTGVVLNLSDSAVTVDLSSYPGLAGSQWRQRWAAPDAIIADGDTDVSISSGTLPAAMTLTLNPYSITSVY
jgi:hypothetical protein